MAYPNAEDYIRAVQQPERSFRTPDLRQAVFDLHPLLGIPMPASGNAAVVFKAAMSGTDTALRFFIREDASSRERYTALGRHFVTHGLDDCVATAAWVDDAISVGGASWPLIHMSWVDGRTLDAYVGHLAQRGDVGSLAALAGGWRAFVGRLQAADFAHGDLQHGNVLIDTSSALRLVDFDGSWIAELSGGPPPHETGHPNYQRTGREWGRWMDTFPGLVIYTALLTLSREPTAWAELQNGENILFSADDFRPPFRTRAWQTIDGIADPEVGHAGEVLRRACATGWQAGDTLEALLTSRPRVTVPPSAPNHAPLYGGVHLPTGRSTWWEQQTSPPAGGPAGAAAGAPAGSVPTGTGPEATTGAPPRTEHKPGAGMPPPPPKAGPDANAADTSGPGPSFRRSGTGSWFDAASAGDAAGPVGTPQPAQPRTRRPVGEILGLSVALAVVAAVVSAIVVSAGGGDAGVAAAVSGLVGLAIAFALLWRRR